MCRLRYFFALFFVVISPATSNDGKCGIELLGKNAARFSFQFQSRQASGPVRWEQATFSEAPAPVVKGGSLTKSNPIRSGQELVLWSLPFDHSVETLALNELETELIAEVDLTVRLDNYILGFGSAGVFPFYASFLFPVYINAENGKLLSEVPLATGISQKIALPETFVLPKIEGFVDASEVGIGRTLIIAPTSNGLFAFREIYPDGMQRGQLRHLKRIPLWHRNDIKMHLESPIDIGALKRTGAICIPIDASSCKSIELITGKDFFPEG